MGISQSTINRMVPYALLIPTGIIMGVALLYPLGYSLITSLYRFDITRPERGMTFVGLNNYSSAIVDPYFQNSLVITFIYGIGTVVTQMLLGVVLALLVDPLGKSKKLTTACLLIPMMLPPVVVAVIWRMMFNPGVGILNYALGFFGVDPLNWLGEFSLALPSVMLVDIWQNTPFVFLMASAGIASLPDEPYEAARIDGASGFDLLRYITLPLLRPILLTAMLIRIIVSFRVFDSVYVLTAGGPGRATDVLSFYIYRLGFKYWNTGYASAVSYLMVFIVMAIALIYIRRVEYE